MIGELLIILFFLLGSIFLFNATTKFPALGARTQVGPAFWPQILLGWIILLACIWLLKFFVSKYKRAPGTPGITPADAMGKQGLTRLVLVIALCLAYVFIIDISGFLISTFIFQILILLVLGTRKMTTIIVTPSLLTAALFGIFIKILHTPLPRGTGVFYTFSRMLY
jgi:putative tricarboxylic transport membrane protein